MPAHAAEKIAKERLLEAGHLCPATSVLAQKSRSQPAPARVQAPWQASAHWRTSPSGPPVFLAHAAWAPLRHLLTCLTLARLLLVAMRPSLLTCSCAIIPMRTITADREESLSHSQQTRRARLGNKNRNEKKQRPTHGHAAKSRRSKVSSPRCTCVSCVSASARQSRAQCRAREFSCKILPLSAADLKVSRSSARLAVRSPHAAASRGNTWPQSTRAVSGRV